MLIDRVENEQYVDGYSQIDSIRNSSNQYKTIDVVLNFISSYSKKFLRIDWKKKREIFVLINLKTILFDFISHFEY
jgi:hypothetical protein